MWPRPSGFETMIAANPLSNGIPTPGSPTPTQQHFLATGDALIDWMPFMNDGYPDEWIQTLTALEQYDFTQIIPGHGEVIPKAQLAFFRGYIMDLIAAVQKAAAEDAPRVDTPPASAQQPTPDRTVSRGRNRGQANRAPGVAHRLGPGSRRGPGGPRPPGASATAWPRTRWGRRARSGSSSAASSRRCGSRRATSAWSWAGTPMTAPSP